MTGLTGMNLTNSSVKHTRSKTDFYQTPPDATQALVDFLALEKDTRIWECACGEGLMADALKQNGYTVFATDLHDYGYGIAGSDFLQARQAYFCTWIITNPPFSKSYKFIEKALLFLEGEIDGFAFLLKSQYWHAKSRYDLFMRHPPAYVLPLTWRPDFEFGRRGGAPTMEIQWCVWNRCGGATQYVPLRRPTEAR